jgi:hypothetical protein
MSARLSAWILAAGAACVGLMLLAGGCGRDRGTPPGAASTSQATQALVFVNDKCPIQGEAIDPAKVTPDLVREYKGQKVAFCCGMCPPQWDKLTDAEKDAKLAKAMKKP